MEFDKSDAKNPKVCARSSAIGVSLVAGNSSFRALSEINRAIRENRVDDYPSANRSLGMYPLEFGMGTSRWEWREHPPQVLNPFGTIGGGFIAIFVDELFSTAIGSLLEEGEWAVSAEMKLSYLRAMRPGAITGVARVVRRTRSLAFMEATVECEGQAAVLASSTWSISRS